MHVGQKFVIISLEVGKKHLYSRCVLLMTRNAFENTVSWIRQVPILLLHGPGILPRCGVKCVLSTPKKAYYFPVISVGSFWPAARV